MGLFDKKPAAPTPRTKTTPAFVPLAITGLGVACHAGDQPYALISSVLGQMSAGQLSDKHKIKQNDGSYAVPRMAYVEEMADEKDRDRMYALATVALKNVLAQLSANVSLDKTLVLLITETSLITRFKKIDTLHFKNYLTEKNSNLSSSVFRILQNDAISSASAVRTAIAELNEGKWQAIIFGGADSLVSIYKCMDLLSEDRLNIVGKTEGIVPGEAAAFVILQVQEEAAKNSTPVLAYLRGLGVAAEPNARESDLAATEGLPSAINQALTQAGMAATDIQGIVHNLGAETVQALEWYQTTQTIWPRRVDEQQRMAVQLGEIDQPEIPDDPIPKIVLPYMTMGEVGAASLPIHLATALAWLEYAADQARWGFPQRYHLLVCETPDVAERGALIISTTLAASA